MAEQEKAAADEGMVVFELTGPRKGYSGTLGGRYRFVDGKISVPQVRKEGVARILCGFYGCNIVGEAPIWKTDENGGSVKVGKTPVKPAGETTTVKSPPTAKTVDPKDAK